MQLLGSPRQQRRPRSSRRRNTRPTLRRALRRRNLTAVLSVGVALHRMPVPRLPAAAVGAVTAVRRVQAVDLTTVHSRRAAIAVCLLGKMLACPCKSVISARTAPSCTAPVAARRSIRLQSWRPLQHLGATTVRARARMVGRGRQGVVRGTVRTGRTGISAPGSLRSLPRKRLPLFARMCPGRLLSPPICQRRQTDVDKTLPLGLRRRGSLLHRC